MKKMILLCVVLVLFPGCLFLPIAGIAVTGGAAYLRYKGLDKEAKALEEFKDSITPEIEDITGE